MSPSPTAGLPAGLATGTVVLDASYVIALLDGEQAAQAYAPLLSRAVLPAPAAGELFYNVHAATRVEPAQVEAGLLALGVRLVDLPVAAARQFPALRGIDALRREEQRARGERPLQTLSLGDLCVLGHAAHAKLPVLTGDRALGHSAPARADRRRPPLPRARHRHVMSCSGSTTCSGAPALISRPLALVCRCERPIRGGMK